MYALKKQAKTPASPLQYKTAYGINPLILTLLAIAISQFKHYGQIVKYFFTVLFLGSLLGVVNPALAAVEVEPNDTCETAQDFTGVSLPFSLSGSAIAKQEGFDADFFEFKGKPGTLVTV